MMGGAIIVLVGLVLGMVISFAGHLYIRHGKYKKIPVEIRGEAWYGIPAWLRLSVVISYGFVVASFAVFLAKLLHINYSALNFNSTIINLTSPLLLAMILFLIERSSLSNRSTGRFRGTWVVAFCLGIALAIFIYSFVPQQPTI